MVVWEETELPIFALLVVEPDGALPAKFLVVVELTEVSDDALSRTGLRCERFRRGRSRCASCRSWFADSVAGT